MKKFFLFTNLFFLCLVMGFYAHSTDVGGIILEDTTWTKGGGIYAIESSTVTIKNTTISENSASGSYKGYRGGICAVSSTIAIENCTISENSVSGSDYGGGGIYAKSGTVNIKNSTVSGNSGNGIYADSGTVTIKDSPISGNSGSGIYATTKETCFGFHEG